MSNMDSLTPSDKRSVLWKIAKYGGFTLLALSVFTGVFIAILYYKADRMFDRIGAGKTNLAEGKTAAATEWVQPAKKKPLAFLLMGLDTREETGSMNTDVIMVLALNPETESATLVSIPRDTLLEPDGLPHRKANYYYPYFNNQDSETAYEKTKEVFSDFLGIPIDYMATVDFRGFEKIIDALGGLTIDVDMDMRYVDTQDGTDINLKKGLQTLNGKQTLDFVRYRKSNRGTEESSDFERNRRQQQVLDQIMAKLKSVEGVMKIGKIMDTVGDHLKTDIPPSLIRDLIKTYYDINRENIQYIHLEGQWISPYVHIAQEDLYEAQLALKRGLGQEDILPSVASRSPATSGDTFYRGGADTSAMNMTEEKDSADRAVYRDVYRATKAQ